MFLYIDTKKSRNNGLCKNGFKIIVRNPKLVKTKLMEMICWLSIF